MKYLLPEIFIATKHFLQKRFNYQVAQLFCRAASKLDYNSLFDYSYLVLLKVDENYNLEYRPKFDSTVMQAYGYFARFFKDYYSGSISIDWTYSKNYVKRYGVY